MKKVFAIAGVVLLVIGVACFLMVRMGLQQDRQKQAETARQMGLPGMAPDTSVAIGELFDFEKLDKMEGKSYAAMAYFGSALVGGGIVALLGSVVLRKRKPNSV